MYRNMVLDVYDDGGQLLHSADGAEKMASVARFIAPDQLHKLPPENFALVIADSGEIHRKFAMIDPGNTQISALYFLYSGQQLPREIRKQAAANLVGGLQRFGLDVPEVLHKMADGATVGNPIFEAVSVGGYSAPEPEKVASAEEIVRERIQGFIAGWNRMAPPQRRDEAVDLIKSAMVVGIAVPRTIYEMYGAEGYGDGIQVGISVRKSLCTSDDQRGAYDDLFAKRAMMDPELFVDHLQQLDLQSGLWRGWDSAIPDPYATTFGRFTSVLDKHASAGDGSDEVGGDGVFSTEAKLSSLVLRPELLKKGGFAPTLIRSFQEDPVGTFEHVPIPIRRVIADLASEASGAMG